MIEREREEKREYGGYANAYFGGGGGGVVGHNGEDGRGSG